MDMQLFVDAPDIGPHGVHADHHFVGDLFVRPAFRKKFQNLLFALVYNALGVPIAAGALYPFFGILLSPLIAAAAMSMSSPMAAGWP